LLISGSVPGLFGRHHRPKARAAASILGDFRRQSKRPAWYSQTNTVLCAWPNGSAKWPSN